MLVTGEVGCTLVMNKGFSGGRGGGCGTVQGRDFNHNPLNISPIL